MSRLPDRTGFSLFFPEGMIALTVDPLTANLDI